MRILVVEDDKEISSSLKKGLEDKNYSVDIARDGEEGEYFALTNDYDVIILDLMLPKKSGWEVCRALRKEGSQIPILMLTALDSVEDKIKGLDYGADDYLTKPFHFGELLARVRSLSRRQSEQKSASLEIADLNVNIATREVYRSGKQINLSSKEFAILEYLLINKNKVMTRQMISEHVWDMNFDPQSNVIDSFIRFLRQKIDKEFEKPLIHTIRGAGYKISDVGE